MDAGRGKEQAHRSGQTAGPGPVDNIQVNAALEDYRPAQPQRSPLFHNAIVGWIMLQCPRQMDVLRLTFCSVLSQVIAAQQQNFRRLLKVGQSSHQGSTRVLIAVMCCNNVHKSLQARRRLAVRTYRLSIYSGR